MEGVAKKILTKPNVQTAKRTILSFQELAIFTKEKEIIKEKYRSNMSLK